MSQDKHTSPTANGIARQLADDTPLQINLRLRLDEMEKAEKARLRLNARRQPSGPELMRLAMRLYDSRRTRERIMRRELFGEPAWDMLLALYCLPKRGWIMTVKAVSCAANVPSTTGLRWQRRLIDEGLIERGPQGHSFAMTLLRLTPSGRALMNEYLTRLFYHDAPTPIKAIEASNR